MRTRRDTLWGYTDYFLICLILDIYGPLRSNVLLELALKHRITKRSFNKIIKKLRKRSSRSGVRYIVVRTTPHDRHIFYYHRRDKGRKVMCRIADYIGIDSHDFLKGFDLEELHAFESLPPRHLQHIPTYEEYCVKREAQTERLRESIRGADPLEDDR